MQSYLILKESSDFLFFRYVPLKKIFFGNKYWF
jgi:hypothetical protein